MERIKLLRLMQEELNTLEYQNMKLQDILEKSARYMKNGKLIPQESAQKISDLLAQTEELREALKGQYETLERNKEMPDSVNTLQSIINTEYEVEERRSMVASVRSRFDQIYTEQECLEPYLERCRTRLKRLDYKNLNKAQCLRALEPYEEYLKAVKETNPMILYDWIGKLEGKFVKEMIVYTTIRKDILFAAPPKIVQKAEETAQTDEKTAQVVEETAQAVEEVENTEKENAQAVEEVENIEEAAKTVEEVEKTEEESTQVVEEVESTEESVQAVEENESTEKENVQEVEEIENTEEESAKTVEEVESTEERAQEVEEVENIEKESEQAVEENESAEELVQTIIFEGETDSASSCACNRKTDAELGSQYVDGGQQSEEEKEAEGAVCETEEVKKIETLTLDFAAFGEVKAEISEGEQKKIGVKLFKSDMKKSSISKAIFQAVVQNRTANFALLMRGTNVGEARLEKEIEKVFQKGYLRKYSLPEMETLYEVSPRIVDVMGMNDLKNIYESMFRLAKAFDINGWREMFDDKLGENYCEVQEKNTEVHNLLHKYIYTKVNEKFSEQKTFKFKRISRIYDENVYLDMRYQIDSPMGKMQIALEEQGERALLVLSMVFPLSPTSADAVWKKLYEVLRNSADWEAMIIAGWNKEQAWSLVGKLLEMIPDQMEGRQTYCYVYQEDEVYSYLSGEKETWKHILNGGDGFRSPNGRQSSVEETSVEETDSEKKSVLAGEENEQEERSQESPLSQIAVTQEMSVDAENEDEPEGTIGAENEDEPESTIAAGNEDEPENMIVAEDEDEPESTIDEEDEDEPESTIGTENEDEPESTIDEEDEDEPESIIGTENEDEPESTIGTENEGELESTIGTENEDEPESTIGTGNEDEPESMIAAESEDESQEDVIVLGNDFSLENVTRNSQIMLAYGRLDVATAFLKAVSLFDKDMAELHKKVAYAVNDPEESPRYTSDNIFQVYAGEEESRYYFVAAALRSYFFTDMEHDYNMKSLYSRVYSQVTNTSVNSVLYQLYYFKKNNNDRGIDDYADYRDCERREWQERKTQIQKEARAVYEQYINSHTSENTSNRRFVVAKSLAFTEKGKLAILLTDITEGKEERLDEMKEILYADFIKDNAKIRLENIDKEKVDCFIDYYWDLAASKMNNVKKSSDLMSALRGNFYNSVERVVEVVCRWAELMEARKVRQDDGGMKLYQQTRNGLMQGMTTAIASLHQEWAEAMKQREYSTAAGVRVLEVTLKELWLRLEGDYKDTAHTYFYINFLLDSNVLLTSNYFPDWKGMFLDLEDFSMPVRICNHFNLWMKKKKTFDMRLEEIFDQYGDDYGSAYLILSYLVQTKQREWSMDEMEKKIEEYVRYAQKDALSQRKSFLENLELAKSYGQIDNSHEDEKKRMVQFIQEWWDYSLQTRNYGFFKQILQKYEEKIHRDARQRGEVLRYKLEQWKAKNPEWENSEQCIRRVKKINGMLERQNYTGAEDILNRIDSWEEDDGFQVFDHDVLQEFLDKYADYYQKVSVMSKALSSVALSSNYSNKYTKGGKRLLESWLSNGGYLGMGKLENLLQNLGFAVESVEQQPRTDKKEYYCVKLKRPLNGKKSNFKHCIAAFGSQAMLREFYVICSYGRCKTDDLVDMYHSLGSTKTILVLLDYALTLPERRELARKIKQKGTSAVFAVLDRVMLMFLADNYNESSINRMLMMLVMPFSYYQPYVMSEVMPPELFMGREDELNKIVSPDGVNIVYGGRQLGKSALLQMAKNEVNENENHDRALVVNIKGLNYKEAARKIAFSLYEEHILQQELDTENWNELARMIRARLLSEKEEPIPYFLLMLDEADRFIESCVDVNYQPFDALKEVQNIGMGRFKFVVAGLRNIVRFHREVALGNNSVITQLKSLTVKPFQVREARELLEMPLYYLGMRFQNEETVLTILANTNYFPGLIQLYCAKLIETLKGSAYECYSELETPPYRICPEHIKKALEDGEVNSQIREKFEITLELDSDNYYKIIALLLAHLCHANQDYSVQTDKGYSAKEIKEECRRYEIGRLKNLTVDQIEALMDELCELNVFRKNEKGEYLYYRYNFFQMMGSASEVEEKILKYMED